jgi:hypothetical protein
MAIGAILTFRVGEVSVILIEQKYIGWDLERRDEIAPLGPLFPYERKFRHMRRRCRRRRLRGGIKQERVRHLQYTGTEVS